MKRSILIFGIIIITIITVKAQIVFNHDTKNLETKEQSSNELYDSIYTDFENFYIEQTSSEEIEDEEMLDIYNELRNEFDLIEQINQEKKEDQLNNKLYAQILKDTKQLTLR